jgi:hypothetical protein
MSFATSPILSLEKLDEGVVILSCIDGEKVDLVVKASPEAVKKVYMRASSSRKQQRLSEGAAAVVRIWHRPVAESRRSFLRLWTRL